MPGISFSGSARLHPHSKKGFLRLRIRRGESLSLCALLFVVMAAAAVMAAVVALAVVVAVMAAVMVFAVVMTVVVTRVRRYEANTHHV